MNKWQRNYRLEVEGSDGKTHIFSYPMTLQFNISRAALASANTSSFRLYNLNKDTRKIIYKDIYSNLTGTFRSVKLMAGYGENLSQIFYGHIQEAMSYKEEGAVEFTTQIDAYDWSFAMINANSSWTSIAPAPKQEVVNRLVDDMIAISPPSGKLGRGVISTFPGEYGRPKIADGNTWEILGEVTNYHNFIDNGLIHCLLDDDVFVGDTAVIDASTGLLSTPKKCEYKLKVDLLFEPGINVGQQVELVSATESLYNGLYKVIGVQHSGIISGAVNGKCRTSLVLHLGEKILNIIKGEVDKTPVALGA
jgi:hypothetical protein